MASARIGKKKSGSRTGSAQAIVESCQGKVPYDAFDELLAVLRTDVASRDAGVRGPALAAVKALEAGKGTAASYVSVLVYFLDHGKPEIRTLAAVALKNHVPYHLRCPVAVKPLAGRLSDPSGKVAAAAAHRLWACARAGVDMEDALPALKRACRSKRPLVRFFASLALGNHLRREGLPPPPIAWPPDGSRPEVSEPCTFPGSFESFACSYEAHGDPGPLAEILDGPLCDPGQEHRCAFCGSPRLNPSCSWRIILIVEATDADEYRCPECGLYTLFERRW